MNKNNYVICSECHGEFWASDPEMDVLCEACIYDFIDNHDDNKFGVEYLKDSEPLTY